MFVKLNQEENNVTGNSTFPEKSCVTGILYGSFVTVAC